MIDKNQQYLVKGFVRETVIKVYFHFHLIKTNKKFFNQIYQSDYRESQKNGFGVFVLKIINQFPWKIIARSIIVFVRVILLLCKSVYLQFATS